jgi:trans-aconitate methyltransferase
MDIQIAKSLIKPCVPNAVQSWADLGAGKGLFTKALSELLQPGSHVYAIDRDAALLPGIKVNSRIQLTTKAIDFAKSDIDLKNLDGILMANSLHFVSDKISLLKTLSSCLNPSGKFILVEYDTDKANTWVPYPISFKRLQQLMRETEFGMATKIGETESMYSSEGIYSALVTLGH